jgi:hypothetical protein
MKLQIILGNWDQRYAQYMEHDIVYGTCGIHPLYLHYIKLNMEFNSRLPLLKGLSDVPEA